MSVCLFLGKKACYPSTCMDRPLEHREVEAPRIARQSAHEDGEIVSLMPRQPLPPQEYPQSLPRPQDCGAAGRIKPLNNSNDTSRIEPAIFRLVV